MRACLPWLLIACADDPDRPTVGAPSVVSATCAADPDHANLARCEVAMEPPGDVVVTLTADDGVARLARSSAPAARHELLVWGLRAETAYTWQAGEIDGALTTGAIPDELAAVSAQVAGRPFGFDAVLLALRCTATWLVMIDGDGRIVWYHRTEVYQGPMDGYAWFPEDRQVAAVNGPALEVVDLAGEVVLRQVGGQDFSGSLHHDTTRWGSLTYALYEVPHADRDVDGFHVWDGGERVGSYFLGDDFLVTPGEGDWSHANGLVADAHGVVTMSLRNLDLVVGVDGDPASPTFLQILWSAAGSDAAPGTPTYTAPAGPLEGFHAQHNATLDGDRLWLFDNEGDGDRSRAARFVLDATTGQVQHEASWFLEDRCDIQSGAVPIPGGVLATCAATGKVSAFREGEVRPAFTLQAQCFPASVVTRGFPVVFDR